MKNSEQLAAIRKQLEELEAQSTVNGNSNSDDPIDRLEFRLNNIGWNMKRIADSLGEIKRMMQEDRIED